MAIDKLTQHGCSAEGKDKVCRSRGGESCAFDGAMIVLQPIADTAHIVHGPIACCGNSWEGRGTLSSRGDLHTRGFTTDMGEIDIVYGSEEKLLNAVRKTYAKVHPKAIFVYSTCVSGLTGEDIDAVCRKADNELGVRVIPVNAPGFVGPKNLGNRLAGEALLEHVIGTGETPVMTHRDINLIGEYNIAGDLWLVEPLLTKAGFRVLSRITGDATFEEITWAHQAKLNVVVCSRALINVAKEMERKYGIPYVEVSFYGSTEIAKALRTIGDGLSFLDGSIGLDEIETAVRHEERLLKESLKSYRHLRGKKALLYTGGVKSWSFVSALMDLGIEVVGVGTKKSTFEDEEKMRAILGSGAPLLEDVAPKSLIRVMNERNADILVAGGRNQYLAVKEGYPFVDVNQERHTAYAGYAGLLNLARQISDSLSFYNAECGLRNAGLKARGRGKSFEIANPKPEILIDPLKHSPVIGAAMALQGIDRALPILHGGQGCSFLGKVLLTKHFREPIALASSKLFVEDVVMGSEQKLADAIDGFIDKNNPALIGVLTSGLSEIKGDDVPRVVNQLKIRNPQSAIITISTPDFEGGLETGYARTIEKIVASLEPEARSAVQNQITVLAGSHLTPADVTEIRTIVESFGLTAVMLPDLSCLDGSRKGISPLASGGASMTEIATVGSSCFTIALGMSMTPAARMLHKKFGTSFEVFPSSAGLAVVDRLIVTLSRVSGRKPSPVLERQRNILVDGMRDAHFYYGGRRIILALEPDLALQMSNWLAEMGASIETAIIPTLSDAADRIQAQSVQIGDLSSLQGGCDLLVANSHAEQTAKRLGTPLYEAGFPVYKTLGYTSKVTVGYRGTLTMIHEVGNLLMKGH